MIAKITSKNQLTLPKSVVQAIGATEYFDVEVRQGQIVLTPVRMQRGDAVRAKLAALGLTEADVAGAVRWARSGATAPALAEPSAAYAPAKTPAKRISKPSKKKTSPRA
jgi:antitoxin component of MazEF toxin-antitoxin module